MEPEQEEAPKHKQKRKFQNPPQYALQRKREPFITATFEMLCNPGFSTVIRFSLDGMAIEIVSLDQLALTVLPKCFKHANANSFIRQLNMHGFRSKVSVEGVERTFFHPLFFRDGPQKWLLRIQRKPVPLLRDSEETKKAKQLKWIHGLKESIAEFEVEKGQQGKSTTSKLLQNSITADGKQDSNSWDSVCSTISDSFLSGTDAPSAESSRSCTPLFDEPEKVV